jgi:hypothetical protein
MGFTSGTFPDVHSEFGSWRVSFTQITWNALGAVHSAKVPSAFDLGRYFVMQTISKSAHHGRLINTDLLQKFMLSS